MVNSSLLSNESRRPFRDISFDYCSCKIGKGKIHPFPTHDEDAVACFALVHADVRGIAPTISHSHYKYFYHVYVFKKIYIVTFIGDYSQLI